MGASKAQHGCLAKGEVAREVPKPSKWVFVLLAARPVHAMLLRNLEA